MACTHVVSFISGQISNFVIFLHVQNLFTVGRQHRRKAARNLEAYLVKRVSDLIHQARLDAVKLYFSKNQEKCDDKRAGAVPKLGNTCPTIGPLKNTLTRERKPKTHASNLKKMLLIIEVVLGHGPRRNNFWYESFVFFTSTELICASLELLSCL